MKGATNEEIKTNGGEFSGLPVSDSGSLNSSYADVFESSGVVIRDCEGSYSRGLLTVTNAVTYNLNKCKSNVVVPYYKLLCLIAWRPFGKDLDCGHRFFTVLNYFYTFLTFCFLFFWYVIRVYTCQGRLMLENPPPTPVPTLSPSPGPNSSVWNWSILIPSERNNHTHHDHNLFVDPCQHVFGTYIVPNILHFLAFIIGFYHFRIQEHEGLYSLMEKVYLQSTCPGKMTKHLRMYLIIGFIWLLLSLATMIFYFYAFGFEYASGIPKDNPRVMYVMVVLIIFTGVFSNAVNLAVVLSYCGQCQLLKYYIEGVAERLEEKSTELKAAMKDILDIKRHFTRLNGMLSLCMSCIVFDLLIVVGISSVLLFNFREMCLTSWLYRVANTLLYGSMLIFLLVQAALLTTRGEKNLLDKALTIRVYGYQSHTQFDIDSFLNFLCMAKLEAQIFTIPVKPSYLWGGLILCVQILIFAFQTGRIIGESKWI